MCGIAAILLFPQERSRAHWQAIRDLFTSNLLAHEQRGNAATGLAVADLHGRISIFKSAMGASKFVGTAEYKETLAQVGPYTTLVLGHTRLPTKGHPSRDGNNHPIQAGPVFGVHNGQIENDDELFAACGCQRAAEVDSEIVFRLIENIDPSALPGRYLDEVRQRIAAMRGQYTFLACDRRKPEQLLVLKHNNPLSMHFHQEWKALIFSSRYAFLRKAVAAPLSAGIMAYDQLMLFDARRLPELGSSPRTILPIGPGCEA